MKSAKLFAVLGAGLVLMSVQSRAQGLFQLTFKGTRSFTNDAGQLITQPINNKTLIQEAINANGGSSNLGPLTLVYAPNADSLGDEVMVINTNKNGIYTNFWLTYKWTTGNDANLTSGDGNQNVRYMYIFDFNPGEEISGDESVGGAIAKTKVTPQNAHTIMGGSVIYFKNFMSGSNVTNEIIFNGNFIVGKQIQ